VGRVLPMPAAKPKAGMANRRRVAIYVSAALALAAGFALLRFTVLAPSVPLARTLGPEILHQPRQQPLRERNAIAGTADPRRKVLAEPPR
jgi:hypothetical protein